MTSLEATPYRYGWADPDTAGAAARRGLSEEVVREISRTKDEPEWMLERRLKALSLFYKKPLPTWGADLSGVDFDQIKYFVRAAEKQASSWEDLPEDIKNTYDKLGIPEAERQRLVAGVAAQYECLAEGTQVWTANRGMVSIESIVPGDRVFSYDEKKNITVVAPVREVRLTGYRDVTAVEVGRKILLATPNHPLLTLRDERKPGRQRARFHRRWATVQELSVSDPVAVQRSLPEFGASRALPPLPHRVRSSNARVPDHSSPDLMWLLGYYLGDGNPQGGSARKGNTHRIQFAVPETDAELRTVISDLCLGLFGMKTQAPDDQRLVFHSKQIVDWFDELGLLRGAYNKVVPEWVYSLPLEERLAFLAGWVDADGSIAPQPSAPMIITSCNAPLLEQGAHLAQLCGIRTSGPFRFESKHPYDASRTIVGYRLQLIGNFDIVPCRNPKRIARMNRRKYHSTSTSLRGMTIRAHTNDFLGFERVNSLTPMGPRAVYDIEVDGPHNFIAEGVIAHNSEVVYHKIREDLEQQGVIFLDTDTALQEHPEIFKEYFGSVIPPGDNKFAALNSATWSGGSFIYVPPGVHVEIPLQAYFRINTENMGQFERTLIIADEGSYVHYVEGCLLQGEQIELPNGETRPVEDIREGDQVRDHTGGTSTVRALIRREYHGDVHTFRPLSTANAFTATSEHPLLIVRRKDVQDSRPPRNNWLPSVSTTKLVAAEPEWVRAEEVGVGDFLVFPKENPAPPETILSPVLGKLAGYYLAEGSSQLINGCKALTFCFHVNEVEYIEEVRSLCEELYGARGSVYTDPSKNCTTITVYTPAGYDVMKANVGDRSWSKRLSPLFYNQGPLFVANLIEGYVNGDGNHFTPASGNSLQCRPATVSHSWAFQLQALLARQGIFATVRLERQAGPATIMGREVTRRDLYKIRWTVDRKMGEIRDAGAYFLVPVKEITTRRHDGPVYNFETNPTNSYLVKGFAVHNCSAPLYSSDSLHSAVVEIVVKKNARVRYTTIQNWSTNVYNLVTKRAAAHEGAVMEWCDANIGSLRTAKYPSVYLLGEHARGEVLSMAMAGPGQHQDTGAKMIHAAPNTSSTIVSKSVSREGGRTSYRGLVQVLEGAKGAKSTVRCDALLVDTISRSDTYPYVDVREDDVTMGHEATVSKIGEDQLFYLMSRGMTEDEAAAMIVRGFIEPVAKQLPMEYALELNRLVELQMEGAVG